MEQTYHKATIDDIPTFTMNELYNVDQHVADLLGVIDILKAGEKQ